MSSGFQKCIFVCTCFKEGKNLYTVPYVKYIRYFDSLAKKPTNGHLTQETNEVKCLSYFILP